MDRSKADLERGFGTGILLFGASVTKVTSKEDNNIPKKLRLQRNRHTATERLVRFPNRVYFTWSKQQDKHDESNDENHELNKLRQQRPTYLVMTFKSIRKLLRSSLVHLGCRGSHNVCPLESVTEELSVPDLIDADDDAEDDVFTVNIVQIDNAHYTALTKYNEIKSSTKKLKNCTFSNTNNGKTCKLKDTTFFYLDLTYEPCKLKYIRMCDSTDDMICNDRKFQNRGCVKKT